MRTPSHSKTVLDSEEYGLWTAFMSADTPPGSPCRSASPDLGSQAREGEGGGGGEGEEDPDGVTDDCEIAFSTCVCGWVSVRFVFFYL